MKKLLAPCCYGVYRDGDNSQDTRKAVFCCWGEEEDGGWGRAVLCALGKSKQAAGVKNKPTSAYQR